MLSQTTSTTRSWEAAWTRADAERWVSTLVERILAMLAYADPVGFPGFDLGPRPEEAWVTTSTVDDAVSRLVSWGINASRHGMCVRVHPGPPGIAKNRTRLSTGVHARQALDVQPAEDGHEQRAMEPLADDGEEDAHEFDALHVGALAGAGRARHHEPGRERGELGVALHLDAVAGEHLEAITGIACCLSG